MRITVTGAYGFVGANLVRALLEKGETVRVADCRRTASLEGLDVEHVDIDVVEGRGLAEAFDGAEAVVHLAAIISITGDPSGMVWRTNVEGAGKAAAAARDAGVPRYVHCSSVHAFDLETCGPSLDETGPRAYADHAPAYDRSKNAGEQAVRASAGGLDVVFVNPTGIIGPHDYEPSRMGETVTQLRDHKIPVNIRGGFDFVDVRDVSAGIIGALERGRTDENYLLSGNRVSVKELGRLVADAAHTHAPRLGVPLEVVEPFAPLVAKLTPADGTPLVTPDALHALRYSPTVSHYKAATELGYTARPIHQTVRDTLEWFAARGQ